MSADDVKFPEVGTWWRNRPEFDGDRGPDEPEFFRVAWVDKKARTVRFLMRGCNIDDMNAWGGPTPLENFWHYWEPAPKFEREADAPAHMELREDIKRVARLFDAARGAAFIPKGEIDKAHSAFAGVAVRAQRATELKVQLEAVEKQLADASRVCAKPGCLAAVVRRDDGRRVCAAGHASRWVEAAESEAARQELKDALVLLDKLRKTLACTDDSQILDSVERLQSTAASLRERVATLEKERDAEKMAREYLEREREVWRTAEARVRELEARLVDAGLCPRGDHKLEDHDERGRHPFCGAGTPTQPPPDPAHKPLGPAPCAVCAKPATCWGRRNGEPRPSDPACDECCAHDTGECERIESTSPAPAQGHELNAHGMCRPSCGACATPTPPPGLLEAVDALESMRMAVESGDMPMGEGAVSELRNYMDDIGNALRAAYDATGGEDWAEKMQDDLRVVLALATTGNLGTTQTPLGQRAVNAVQALREDAAKYRTAVERLNEAVVRMPSVAKRQVREVLEWMLSLDTTKGTA